MPEAEAATRGPADASVTVQRPPGTDGAARRPRLRYELLGCAVHGHELVDQSSAEHSEYGDLLVRAEPGSPDGSGQAFSWYRRLRCDAWVPLIDDHQPAPHAGDLEVPLRGRPLRDRFVLRVIAVDRVVHFLLLGAVAIVIFLFADHRSALRGSYTRILNRLQGSVGGPLTDTTRTGLLHDLDRLFAVPTSRLYLYGAAIAVYAAVNGIEAVGLWRSKRWAEYLTPAAEPTRQERTGTPAGNRCTEPRRGNPRRAHATSPSTRAAGGPTPASAP